MIARLALKRKTFFFCKEQLARHTEDEKINEKKNGASTDRRVRYTSRERERARDARLRENVSQTLLIT